MEQLGFTVLDLNVGDINIGSDAVDVVAKEQPDEDYDEITNMLDFGDSEAYKDDDNPYDIDVVMRLTNTDGCSQDKTQRSAAPKVQVFLGTRGTNK